MSDNHKGLFPDFTEDEMAAMPSPVRYPTQADGDVVRGEWEIVPSAQYTTSVRFGRLQYLPVLHGGVGNQWSELCWPDDGYEYAIMRRKRQDVCP